MLGDITVADEIYIVCGYTDMRRAIDGLCAIVQDKLHIDPSAVPCICSAEKDVTGSKHSSGKETASCSSTNGWKYRDVSDGPEIPRK